MELAFLVVMRIALKILHAPLALCGAWLAARASVASGAYSHTTEIAAVAATLDLLLRAVSPTRLPRAVQQRCSSSHSLHSYASIQGTWVAPPGTRAFPAPASGAPAALFATDVTTTAATPPVAAARVLLPTTVPLSQAYVRCTRVARISTRPSSRSRTAGPSLFDGGQDRYGRRTWPLWRRYPAPGFFPSIVPPPPRLSLLHPLLHWRRASRLRHSCSRRWPNLGGSPPLCFHHHNRVRGVRRALVDRVNCGTNSDGRMVAAADDGRRLHAPHLWWRGPRPWMLRHSRRQKKSVVHAHIKLLTIVVMNSTHVLLNYLCIVPIVNLVAESQLTRTVCQKFVTTSIPLQSASIRPKRENPVVCLERLDPSMALLGSCSTDQAAKRGERPRSPRPLFPIMMRSRGGRRARRGRRPS